MFRIFSPNTKLDEVLYDVTHYCLKSDVQNHQHDCIEMVFITSGTGVQIINGKRENVYPGCATIIHPGCYHSFTESRDLELYNVSCVPEVLEHLGIQLTFFRNRKHFFNEKNLYSSLRFNGLNWHDVANLLAAMHEAYWDKEREKRHSDLRSFFSILLIFLMQAYRPPLENSTMSPAEVARYLELHCAQKLSLAEIARKAGLSVSLLQLRFKEYFGIPPMKYLAEYRLKHAAELLAETSLSQKAIANECGFYDSNYFIKCYKEYFGISPAKQRRLLKLNATFPGINC